jgi:hypothetical protein
MERERRRSGIGTHIGTNGSKRPSRIRSPCRSRGCGRGFDFWAGGCSEIERLSMAFRGVNEWCPTFGTAFDFVPGFVPGLPSMFALRAQLP